MFEMLSFTDGGPWLRNDWPFFVSRAFLFSAAGENVRRYSYFSRPTEIELRQGLPSTARKYSVR